MLSRLLRHIPLAALAALTLLLPAAAGAAPPADGDRCMGPPTCRPASRSRG